MQSLAKPKEKEPDAVKTMQDVRGKATILDRTSQNWINQFDTLILTPAEKCVVRDSKGNITGWKQEVLDNPAMAGFIEGDFNALLAHMRVVIAEKLQGDLGKLTKAERQKLEKLAERIDALAQISLSEEEYDSLSSVVSEIESRPAATGEVPAAEVSTHETETVRTRLGVPRRAKGVKGEAKVGNVDLIVATELDFHVSEAAETAFERQLTRGLTADIMGKSPKSLKYDGNAALGFFTEIVREGTGHAISVNDLLNPNSWNSDVEGFLTSLFSVASTAGGAHNLSSSEIADVFRLLRNGEVIAALNACRGTPLGNTLYESFNNALDPRSTSTRKPVVMFSAGFEVAPENMDKRTSPAWDVGDKHKAYISPVAEANVTVSEVSGWRLVDNNGTYELVRRDLGTETDVEAMAGPRLTIPFDRNHFQNLEITVMPTYDSRSNLFGGKAIVTYRDERGLQIKEVSLSYYLTADVSANKEITNIGGEGGVMLGIVEDDILPFSIGVIMRVDAAFQTQLMDTGSAIVTYTPQLSATVGRVTARGGVTVPHGARSRDDITSRAGLEVRIADGMYLSADGQYEPGFGHAAIVGFRWLF